jgi:hypothetical protein
MDYNDYYQSGGFYDIEREARQSAAAKAAAATQTAAARKAEVNKSADEQARAAYIAYLQGARDLPQQLAAAGHSGGVSETSAVRLQAGWQDRSAQIESSRQSALLAIDAAVNEARLSGDGALADRLAELKAQAQSQWNAERVRGEENARADAARAEDLARDEARYTSERAYKQEQDAAAAAWQQTLLEYQKQLDALKLALEYDKLSARYPVPAPVAAPVPAPAPVTAPAASPVSEKTAPVRERTLPLPRVRDTGSGGLNIRTQAVR